MSSAADRLEDSFPHGSVAGYRDGCRDGGCPAPMACRDVYRRYNGDFGFRRLVDAGVPLEEILQRDAAEREGIEQRDRAAARAVKLGATAAPAKPGAGPKAPAKPKREKPAPPLPTPAVDPLETWREERDAWRAQRKELYRVMRAAELAVDTAIADRDRAQLAFAEFVEAGEPTKPEQPKRRQRQRADVEAGIRRLQAAGLSDAEAADELGITRAYAGIVRRDLQLPANVKRAAARAPRAPRQVLGHGTNASYARVRAAATTAGALSVSITAPGWRRAVRSPPRSRPSTTATPTATSSVVARGSCARPRRRARMPRSPRSVVDVVRLASLRPRRVSKPSRCVCTCAR